MSILHKGKNDIMVANDNDSGQLFALSRNTFQELAHPERSLVVSPQIIQEVGPGPAVVHAVLVSHDDGQGVEMSLQEIGAESGVSSKSAQRHIEKLVELGYLKAETQTHGGQKSNRYQVPSAFGLPERQVNLSGAPGQIDLPVRFPYMSDVSSESVDSSISSSDLFISPAPVGNPPERQVILAETEDTWTPSPICWPAPGTPMPNLAKPKLGQKGPFRAYIEAKWVVTFLEGYVLAKANLERRQKGWKLLEAIPEHRKLRWLKDAELLLADHPVSEVAEIMTWVFEHCGGVLPFDVVDSRGYRRKDTERKVTSIRSVRESWDQLWEAHSLGKTDHTRVDYSEPLSDGQENAVQDLIEAWEDFWVCNFAHGQEIHPARRGSWVKQIRQLIIEHQLDPAELLDVISGLARFRSEMEHTRYFEPRHLHRDPIEWDMVRHRLKVCEIRSRRECAQVVKTASAAPARRDTEDDEDREVAATPTFWRDRAEDDNSWDSAPWEVRRKQIIAARAQQPAGAAGSTQPTQPFTQRLQASLEANKVAPVAVAG